MTLNIDFSFLNELEDDNEEQETFILDDAIETVYDRPEKYGDPEDSFGLIAEWWGDYLGVEIEPYEVCDLFILMKVARNKEGVYHRDNPEDIAGYAENCARLRSEE